MKELITKRLRSSRSHADLSQTAVEIYAGVGQSTISQWENGLIPNALPWLAQIADQYDVSADYLLGLTDAPDPAAQSAIPVDAIHMAELFVKLDAQKKRDCLRTSPIPPFTLATVRCVGRCVSRFGSC